MPLEHQSSPSISVVIPSHNDARRLVDALESIASQTLQPSQIIISDDGSTDDTPRVVSEFAARCTIPVRYLRHAERKGVVATRNEGIAAADGVWIANCDSDDYWAPAKLERQAAFIRAWQGAPIALLGTYGLNVNDKRRVISTADMGPRSEDEYRDTVAAGGVFFVIHSSTIFSRGDFLRAGGYTEEYGAADDLHFFCKMGRLGPVAVVPEPLTMYRKRPGSIQTASFWDQRYQLDRLGENERRRTQDQPPLDPESFRRLRTWDVPRWRNGYLRYGWSKYHYRRGSVDFVNGHPLRGAARLAFALMMGQDFGRTRTALANSVRVRLRRR